MILRRVVGGCEAFGSILKKLNESFIYFPEKVSPLSEGGQISVATP